MSENKLCSICGRELKFYERGAASVCLTCEMLPKMKARINALEEAITEASLGLIEGEELGDYATGSKAALKTLGKVMDADAMKRMGL